MAADTGAVDHVIPIGALPRGCVPDGIVERHFVGANDAHIEAYGGCDTLMSTREGPMACKYQGRRSAGRLALRMALASTTFSFTTGWESSCRPGSSTRS